MELWRSVVGYEGLYEVSNLGQVRNAQTRYVLKPAFKTYLRVGLHKEGNHKVHDIHRLVAKAFISVSDYKQTIVDHINGVKTDNRVENLRWVTPSQNMMNKPDRKRNSSGYTGISWSNQYGQWKVCITSNGKTVFGGRFDELVQAIEKRKELEDEYFGEYSFKKGTT